MVKLRLDMTARNDIEARFEEVCGFTKGFFSTESQRVWQLLFSVQEDMGIAGDLLEVGVLDGKSAAWSLLHMRGSERHVLVDARKSPGVDRMIETVGVEPKSVKFVEKRSEHAVDEVGGSYRWIHIDGGHSYETVLSDAQLFVPMLKPGGVLVFDDFLNARWAEITDALITFLRSSAGQEFSPFLYGFNKLYVARRGWHQTYFESLVERAPQEIGETIPKVEGGRLRLCGAECLVFRAWPREDKKMYLRYVVRDY